MNTLSILLAEIPKEKANQANEKLLWAGGMLVLTFLLAAMILAIADRWRKRRLEGDLQKGDPLSPYREMYATGELSQEEYVTIRRKLIGQYVEPKEQTPSSDDDGSSEAHPDRPPPET